MKEQQSVEQIALNIVCNHGVYIPSDLTQEVSQQGSIVVHPLEPGHSSSHCTRHFCSWD